MFVNTPQSFYVIYQLFIVYLLSFMRVYIFHLFIRVLFKYYCIMCILSPVMWFYRAWGSVITYWQRLRKSSTDVLLNSAYKTVCTEDHPWIQSVQHFLESNGFRDHYHQNVDLHDEFYKIFINRLNVQFEQVSFVKTRESNRFTVLHNLKDTFGKSKYINVIRNADIRLIFNRLRTDLNVLKTCKINTDINKNCPYGCNEQETVAHLLIRCRKFDEARSEFVSLCAIPRYKLSNEHYMLNIFWI